MKFKYILGLCVLVGVVIGTALVFIFFFHHPTQTRHVTTMPALPSPSPEASPVNSTSWVSPNGKKTLIMKVQKKDRTSSTYSFLVSSSATESGQVIFSKTLDAKTTMSIPFNTWSPDNQHFFIQEHDVMGTRTFVLKASGQPFADGQPFLDINLLFIQKDNGYRLKEITGWAAPTLLIVNTYAADSDKLGPSFWFDISRKSLIRLATSFQ